MRDVAEPDLEQLIRRSRGEPVALGTLLELYREYLTLLARLQIGQELQRKMDPSDVVQEAFLEAHRAFAQFDGTTESQLLAWLRRILASRLGMMVRHYTRKRRDVRLEQQLEVGVERSSQALEGAALMVRSTPSQSAARREQSVMLANGLSKLPSHYREVIILHHLESVPFPEVALRMGRTVDSVKKLWIRALAELRRSLGE